MRVGLLLAVASIGGIVGLLLFLNAPRHPDIRSRRRRWILALQISTAILVVVGALQLTWPRTTGPRVWIIVVLDLAMWLVVVLGTYRRLAIYRFKAPRP